MASKARLSSALLLTLASVIESPSPGQPNQLVLATGSSNPLPYLCEGGQPTAAAVAASGIAESSTGVLYFLDAYSNSIRSIRGGRLVTEIGGSAVETGRVAPLESFPITEPLVCFGSSGSVLYFATPSRIYRGENGYGYPVVGNGYPASGAPSSAAAGHSIAISPTALLGAPGGICYFVSNHAIFRLNADSTVTHLAGTGTAGYSGDGGPATAAAVSGPKALALGASGELYLADTGNHAIRRVDPVSGTITTIAGNGVAGYSGDGGSASSGAFSSPAGLVVRSDGSLIVADTGNNALRQISPGGTLSTVYTSSGFLRPASLLEADAGLVVLHAIPQGGVGNLQLTTFDSAWNATPMFRTDAPLAAGPGLVPVKAQGVEPGVLDPYAVLGGFNQAVALHGEVHVWSPTHSQLFVPRSTSGGRLRLVLPDLVRAGNALSLLSVGDLLLWGEFNPPQAISLRGARPNHQRHPALRGSLLSRSAFAPIPADAADWLLYDDVALILGPWQQPALIGGMPGETDLRNICFSDGLNIYNSRNEPIGGYTNLYGGGIAGLDEIPIVPSRVQPWLPQLSISSVTMRFPGRPVFASGSAIYEMNAAKDKYVRIAGGSTSGFAGDGGPAVAALFSNSLRLSGMRDGGLLVVDVFNRRVRRIDPAGIVTTIAGNGESPANVWDGDGGPATSAPLQVYGAVERANGRIAIAAGSIREFPIGGNISTIAGLTGPAPGDCYIDGMPAFMADISPSSVTVGPDGTVYIADLARSSILTLDYGVYRVVGTGVLGDSGDGGPGRMATVGQVPAMTVHPDGRLYFADILSNRVRVWDPATDLVSPVAGTGSPGYSGDGGSALSAALNQPAGLAVSPTDGALLVADLLNNAVRRIDPVTGVITTIAGGNGAGFSGDGGPALSAQLNMPFGICFDQQGNLYIADSGNLRVRRVDPVTNLIETFQDNINAGPLAWHEETGSLYFGEFLFHTVGRVSGGVVETIAGNGATGVPREGDALQQPVQSPYAVAIHPSDQAIFVASPFTRHLIEVWFDGGSLASKIAVEGSGPSLVVRPVARERDDGSGSGSCTSSSPLYKGSNVRFYARALGTTEWSQLHAGPPLTLPPQFLPLYENTGWEAIRGLLPDGGTPFAVVSAANHCGNGTVYYDLSPTVFEVDTRNLPDGLCEITSVVGAAPPQASPGAGSVAVIRVSKAADSVTYEGATSLPVVLRGPSPPIRLTISNLKAEYYQQNRAKIEYALISDVASPSSLTPLQVKITTPLAENRKLASDVPELASTTSEMIIEYSEGLLGGFEPEDVTTAYRHRGARVDTFPVIVDTQSSTFTVIVPQEQLASGAVGVDTEVWYFGAASPTSVPDWMLF